MAQVVMVITGGAGMATRAGGVEIINAPAGMTKQQAMAALQKRLAEQAGK